MDGQTGIRGGCYCYCLIANDGVVVLEAQQQQDEKVSNTIHVKYAIKIPIWQRFIASEFYISIFILFHVFSFARLDFKLWLGTPLVSPN